jgi:hypothetical protein
MTCFVGGRIIVYKLENDFFPNLKLSLGVCQSQHIRGRIERRNIRGISRRSFWVDKHLSDERAMATKLEGRQNSGGIVAVVD